MAGLKMPKKLSKGSIILFVLAAAITGFTSLKTIDLLKFTMSGDEEAFAWFGWACFEGGLAAWIFFSGSGARRDQRTIATLMVWFNLIAVAAAFITDTVLVVGRKGDLAIDQGVLTWIVIIAVSIVVIANLVAVVGTHQLDPDTRKRIKDEEYQEALDEAQEAAEHAIEIERLKQITKNAAAIAPHIGYQQGMDWTQQMYNRFALPGMAQSPSLPSPQVVQSQQQPAQGPAPYKMSPELLAQVRVTSPGTFMQQEKPSFFGKIGNMFTGKQESQPDNVMSSDKSSTSVQPVAQEPFFTEQYTMEDLRRQLRENPPVGMQGWLNLYHESGDDAVMTFADFIKQMKESTSSPLQSPQMTPANHEGISSQNGHQK